MNKLEIFRRYSAFVALSFSTLVYARSIYIHQSVETEHLILALLSGAVVGEAIGMGVILNEKLKISQK